MIHHLESHNPSTFNMSSCREELALSRAATREELKGKRVRNGFLQFSGSTIEAPWLLPTQSVP